MQFLLAFFVAVSALQAEAPPREYVPTVSTASLDFLAPYIMAKKPFEGPLRGEILNSLGQPCGFTQMRTKDKAPSYFYQGKPGDTSILKFNDPECMDLGYLGAKHKETVLGMNQRMINQSLIRWHHNPHMGSFTQDQAEPEHLKPGGKIGGKTVQSRGWCLPSSEHRWAAMLVEYVEENNAIAYVLHGVGLGCAKEPAKTTKLVAPASDVASIRVRFIACRKPEGYIKRTSAYVLMKLIYPQGAEDALSPGVLAFDDCLWPDKDRKVRKGDTLNVPLISKKDGVALDHDEMILGLTVYPCENADCTSTDSEGFWVPVFAFGS